MNKQTEALKLALEALAKANDFLFNWHENESDNEADAYATARELGDKAITAIREALAEHPAQQQEPVAWMWRCKPYCDWPEWSVSLKRPADSGRDGHKRTEGYEDVPLYTSPPAGARTEDGCSAASKPWVGLTKEEIDSKYQMSFSTFEAGIGFDTKIVQRFDLNKFARAIEAKLREKNGG